MQIVERMFDIMTKKNINNATLAKHLNIRNHVISQWKTRKTDPPSKYIILICDILDVSVEYLLTGVETIPQQTFNTSQIKPIFYDLYETLDYGEQMKIIGHLERIAKECKNNQKSSEGKSLIS